MDCKLIGIVPARMQASRFPGKPLKDILGMPMVEHVYRRARLFEYWDALVLTTCDEEIRLFSESVGIPVIMSSNLHVRALDRVAEAANLIDLDLSDDDIVVNVQGDEPMLRPDMFERILDEFNQSEASVVFLTMDITDEAQYFDPNILKVVHNLDGYAIYTSRSPVPYARIFSTALGAKRIYGIFAFRWRTLREFIDLEESPLEKKEACDINRLFDHGYKVRIARYRSIPSFSVDCVDDLKNVERCMADDPYFGLY